MMFDKIKALFAGARAPRPVPAPRSEVEELTDEYTELSQHLENVKARRREVAARLEELKGA